MTVIPWDYKSDGSDGLSLDPSVGSSLGVFSAPGGVSISGVAGTGASPSMATRPLFIGQLGMTQLRLGIYVSTLGTARCRLALYDNPPMEDRTLYPRDLLVDFGEILLNAVGTQYTSLESVALANGVYWAAFMFDGGTATIQKRANNDTEALLLGADPATAACHYGVNVAQVYGAFPATFPPGGSYTVQSTYAGALAELRHRPY